MSAIFGSASRIEGVARTLRNWLRRSSHDIGGLARAGIAVAALALVATALLLSGGSMSPLTQAQLEKLEEEAREATERRFDTPQESVEHFLLKRSPTAVQTRGAKPGVTGLTSIPYERYREAMAHTERMPLHSTELGKALPNNTA